MRNPFNLKKSIEDQERELTQNWGELEFDESSWIKSKERLLEREVGLGVTVRTLWFLTMILFGVIIVRLVELSIVRHAHFLEVVEKNRLRTEYIPAPRGGIYDKWGVVLASSRPSFELVANPANFPKKEEERMQVVEKVSEITGLPKEQIDVLFAGSLDKDPKLIPVKQNLAQEEALIFHEQENTLPGFRVLNIPIRDYKNSKTFAHLLGYPGKISKEEYESLSKDGYLYNDFLGKTGLEQIYEAELRGKFGEIQVEVDAQGLVKKIFGEKKALTGKNLFLNIDAALQEKLYETLEKRLKMLGRKSAAAIALNPQNGKILALLSFPSFDNNRFAEGISLIEYQTLSRDKNRPLFNRAVSGLYPPGSTVKPMIASSALQEKVITAGTIIRDEGRIVVPNVYGGPDYYFYGYGRKALGKMEIRRAIALSSDIFFYVLGGGYKPASIEGLGIGKLATYFRKFKIHETLGIDLPGEATGVVPDPEWKKQKFAGDEIASRWFLGDTYHVSIGQGDLLVTPLHVLSWVSSIANGGKIYRPLVVEKIIDQNDQVVKQFEPEVLAELPISRENLEIAKQGMGQAVTEGTAKSLGSLSVTSGGKTGTAQFDARNPNRTHAWFAAFAPYENPEIAILVLIEDGGEGGTNSVPVVREVLDWWASKRYLKQDNQ